MSRFGLETCDGRCVFCSRQVKLFRFFGGWWRTYSHKSKLGPGRCSATVGVPLVDTENREEH